jgi:hypothetical protein
MAGPKKSAKRGAAKKRGAPKRKSAKKKAGGKRSSKRGAGKTAALKGAKLRRQARKGLKAARGGLDTVLQAGEKTWKTLKSTTAQVVEGVKDTFVAEPRSTSRRSNSE